LDRSLLVWTVQLTAALMASLRTEWMLWSGLRVPTMPAAAADDGVDAAPRVGQAARRVDLCLGGSGSACT
jgi:hypothetical protein